MSSGTAILVGCQLTIADLKAENAGLEAESDRLRVATVSAEPGAAEDGGGM